MLFAESRDCSVLHSSTSSKFKLTANYSIAYDSFTVIPWASDGVHCSDVHVVDECQSRSSDGGEGSSERVSGDEQLPTFPLLLV